MFTIENTNGFDAETLAKMNTELEAVLESLKDENGEIDNTLAKHAEEKIFNKYC